MPSDVHRFMSQVLCQMKGLVEVITLEDSFGSNFTEVRVAIILNLFWIFFHGILLQMLSNLYKSFSSDVIKSGQKK